MQVGTTLPNLSDYEPIGTLKILRRKILIPMIIL